MRWRPPKKPKAGDKRTTTKFAFLPVLMDSGIKVWLELYIVEHEYHELCYRTVGECGTRGYHHWVTAARQEIPNYPAARLVEGKFRSKGD